MLLAGLLLALLYALDSETRHHLHDTLAALIPSDFPSLQEPRRVMAPGQAVTTDSVPRDTVAVTPDATADNTTPSAATVLAAHDTAATRPDDTAEVAVKSAPPPVSLQITTVETGQVAASPILSAIEAELAESSLQVSYTNDGSLKVNLTGDGVFEFNSTQISDSAGSTLSQLAGVLAARGEVSVHVIGHTDSSGHPEYNLNLSQRRAQAVVDYLVEKGLPEDRTRSEGRGDLDTRLEEYTRDQPELRRRVEIYIRPL
jgi:outer membrane protein OmpA-like peptidoglycan-associated protein